MRNNAVVHYVQVRVYVDGQLAGFYPALYTMFTVGQEPQL